MKRFFDPCRRYRQDICLLAGGVLAGPEQDEIENHLAACADCQKYFAEVKAVTVPLTNWAENSPCIQPSQAVQTRWAKALQAAGRPEPVRRETPAAAFREWWRDAIWPWRRIWARLAVVWVVILAGNISLREHSPVLTAKSAAPSQEAIASFKDQQKLLAELLADHSAPRDAERQKFFSSKPRTERYEAIAV